MIFFTLLSLTLSLPDIPSYNPNKPNTAWNYNMHGIPYESTDVFQVKDELYEREKCKTCCRIIIASEYNYEKERLFIDQDDRDGNKRYVMDLEFDNIRCCRQISASNQLILLRPLQQEKQTQYWEFAPYKMFISYPIPKRVHDICGGANLNSYMIIWQKKAPLDSGTNNQRFVYIHPYETNYYKAGSKEQKYPKHFYVPFKTDMDLCYGAQKKSEDFKRASGNSDYRYDLVDGWQIFARQCDSKDPTQKFIPVFA